MCPSKIAIPELRKELVRRSNHLMMDEALMPKTERQNGFTQYCPIAGKANSPLCRNCGQALGHGCPNVDLAGSSTVEAQLCIMLKTVAEQLKKPQTDPNRKTEGMQAYDNTRACFNFIFADTHCYRYKREL